jgi:hypothetical protein
MRNPMKEYADPERLEARLKQGPLISMSVGSIILYAARIEYHLERAIWRITDFKPEGTRPPTDAKTITDLVEILHQAGVDHLSGDARTMIDIWCTAASKAFQLRHDIAHGISYSMETSFIFNRNPRLNGEMRKRPPTMFWADQHVLDLVRGGFAVLFRCIAEASSPQKVLGDLATGECLYALREAKSVFGEFTSPTYNPSFEKY